MYPNFLMSFLTVTARLDNGHNNVLSRHEGELLRDPPRDNARVDHKPLAYVLQGSQHNVRGQECLGECDPPIRTIGPSATNVCKIMTNHVPVVQCTLKPLRARSH